MPSSIVTAGDEAGVLSLVRSRCAHVAAEATSVLIDEPGLHAFAGRLAEEPSARNPNRDLYFVGTSRDTVSYVVTWDTVNFGSGWHPYLRKIEGLSGARTMMTRLKNHFARRGPLDPVQLSAITPKACAEIFQQPMEPPVDTLMELFAAALRELGSLLVRKYHSDFEALVEASNHSADRLITALMELVNFRDIADYNGVTVPLLKRAQLMVADLALTLDGKGLGNFADVNELTIFSDNLIPHVLRLEGVLHFSPDLLAAIQGGALLEPGSKEEVEMRAVTVHAGEQLVGLLRRQHRDINAMTLGHLLWARGQQPLFKKAPRPRSRTIYY